jgi:polar amino acid transport system substrate-binding protein
MFRASSAPGSALLLLCLALLAACGGDPRAAAPQPVPAREGDIYARVMKDKRVRVGVKADTPPFGLRQGKTFVGFDVDIALALANTLGIEQVEFVPVTSSERSDKVVSGEVDMVIASMTITRYRERRVDFTQPYYEDHGTLLVKAGSPIASYLDLKGRSVGVEKGSTTWYYLPQVAPDCKLVVVDTNAALVTALERDQVDAIASDSTILLGIKAAAKDPAAYRLAGDTFTSEPYGIAVPENQSAWRKALNRALMEIYEKGQWQAIVDTWFGPGTAYAHHIDFRPAIYPH